MRLHELVEAPQYAQETEFLLNDNDINMEFYNEILEDPTLVKLEDMSGCTLYKTDWCISALDLNTKKVIFHNEYEITTAADLKVAVQKKLWRDRLDARSRSIPVNVFWKYVFTMVNRVMTDDLQTMKGSNFWINLVVDSFAKGIKVGIYLSDEDKVHEVTDAQFKQLLNKKQIWGYSPDFRKVRVIIGNQL
jgi:hypothetical protein